MKGEMLLPGSAAGPLLKLAEPLSFWGGVDPNTGRIIQVRHPDCGRSVAGTMLALPGTIGSSSSSAVLLELIRAGRAPAALIMIEVDAILLVGALVAREMGWPPPPAVKLVRADFEALSGEQLVLAPDGSLIEEVRIGPARSAEDLAAAARLFRDYAASLDVDLAYQNFEQELAGLPGPYAPPGGALLLARDLTGEAIGCVALRRLDGGVCEMKRLYVSPRARGTRLGLRLAEAIIAEAGRLAYAEIRLDTLPDMTDAQALYRRLGFEPMEPYYQTPVAGTVFLRRKLGAT